MTSTVPVRQSLKTRITLGTLGIFLVSLWGLSYYASQMLHDDMERTLGQQQLSSVAVVVDAINADLREHMEALQAVAATISPAIFGNAAGLQHLLEQGPLLQRHFNGGIVACGLDGSAIADVPRTAGRIGINYMDIDTIAAALKEGKSTVGRPVMGKKLQAPLFGMTVPVRDAQGTVIGALSGVTNLGKPGFFDMIAKSSYGKTGGYMLVAPQFRLVVTATDKRRTMELLPAPGVDALVDRFVGGYEGSGVAVNPRGEEVLASAWGVPVAGWYVAAVLPTAEAFAPVDAMQQRMLLATLLLMLLAGGLTWWLLRRELAPLLAAARTLATLSHGKQPLVPLPIARLDEIGQLISGFNHLLETLAWRESDLRIAAITFECQEGMIVTDANRVILRTNHSFTRIMGYTNEEVVGSTTAFMRSDRHPAAFYDAAWDTARRDRTWQAEVWHQRKNGEVFPQWLTSTAVRDAHGDVTHFVVTHIDITHEKQQEAERLAHEAAHRDTLVREVHHRIKNNLQGIMGLLRQFAQKHPDTADLIHQAIGQVQGISVIHGLQGRAVTSSVRVCELTGAIADEIQNLWQTTVALDIPPAWRPCVIADTEAVPIALVLNELILNAVKHGGKASGMVSITLRKGPRPDVVQVKITNAGQLASDGGRTDTPHSGLHLISALMPPKGARIVQEQQGDLVITLLELAPPVISQNPKEPT